MKKYIIYIFYIILLSSLVFADGKVDYKMKLVCSSNSMYPAINCTNLLTVNTVNLNEPLELGEVYCYYPDYRNFYVPAYFMICHRLIKINNDNLIFKGDNNQETDPPIYKRQIHLKIVNIS